LKHERDQQNTRFEKTVKQKDEEIERLKQELTAAKNAQK
jgi:hypothetical protein